MGGHATLRLRSSARFRFASDASDEDIRDVRARPYEELYPCEGNAHQNAQRSQG
jgi:hypothetical protein